MKGTLHEGMARKEQIDELWNQLKFHSLSHYIPSIRKYSAADGIDTAQFEVGHKIFLKKYFGRTNKSKNFEEQIASHNTRVSKMSAFESMLLAHRTTTSVVNVENKAKVTTVSGVAMITDWIGWRSIPPKICKMLNLSIDQTTTAAKAQSGTGLCGFLAALGEIVKDCREMMMQERRKHRLHREHCDQNTMWIRNYPVQFFPSICCWKWTANTEELEPEFLRCVENWRGEGKRHDFCWIQEIPPGETSELWDGRCCGQIQAIVHVLDIGYAEEDLEDGFPSYYDVLIDVYPWVVKGNEKGKPHKMHGMVELHAPQVPTVTNPRSLK
ncbi:hypothetical protein K3495_g5060 [Podosphaera aphanis]|nr:hypothetical protein K3495_g5060 [Podosphaera aphanis]